MNANFVQNRLVELRNRLKEHFDLPSDDVDKKVEEIEKIKAVLEQYQQEINYVLVSHSSKNMALFYISRIHGMLDILHANQLFDHKKDQSSIQELRAKAAEKLQEAKEIRDEEKNGEVVQLMEFLLAFDMSQLALEFHVRKLAEDTERHDEKVLCYFESMVRLLNEAAQNTTTEVSLESYRKMLSDYFVRIIQQVSPYKVRKFLNEHQLTIRTLLSEDARDYYCALFPEKYHYDFAAKTLDEAYKHSVHFMMVMEPFFRSFIQEGIEDAAFINEVISELEKIDSAFASMPVFKKGRNQEENIKVDYIIGAKVYISKSLCFAYLAQAKGLVSDKNQFAECAEKVKAKSNDVLRLSTKAQTVIRYHETLSDMHEANCRLFMIQKIDDNSVSDLCRCFVMAIQELSQASDAGQSIRFRADLFEEIESLSKESFSDQLLNVAKEIQRIHNVPKQIKSIAAEICPIEVKKQNKSENGKQVRSQPRGSKKYRRRKPDKAAREEREARRQEMAEKARLMQEAESKRIEEEREKRAEFKKQQAEDQRLQEERLRESKKALIAMRKQQVGKVVINKGENTEEAPSPEAPGFER